jgi:multidrug resistance protein, MATE family
MGHLFTTQVKKTNLLPELNACLVLALPLAGAQLAQSATAFIDTVMMGWLGSQTLAAGGLGATLFNNLLTVGSGILTAVSPLVAEAFGASKPQQISRIVQQGLWLAAVLTVPVVLLISQSSHVLSLLGQEPGTAALATVYLKAIAWGYLPGYGFAVLRNYVSGLSKPRPVTAIIVFGTLFNAIANYIFMFGKLGLPALGLAGIGYASALSLWGMFIALALYVSWQQPFRAHAIFPALLRVGWQGMGELLRVGIPIGTFAIVESGLFAVTTILIGQMGSELLAAHQIALQTVAITFMVPLGTSFATTIRVGQLYGQGEFQRARFAGYVGIGLGGVFMGLMALVMWVMPEPIVSLYLDLSDPINQPVVSLAKQLLGVAAMFQLADGIQVCAVGALRGFKDTYIPMLIGIAAYWGVGLTSGYVLSRTLGLGAVGLWWGLALGLAVASLVLTWRFATLRLGRTAIAQP